jgi:hypothetical protein
MYFLFKFQEAFSFSVLVVVLLLPSADYSCNVFKQKLSEPYSAQAEKD